jgi:hypothetical protein
LIALLLVFGTIAAYRILKSPSPVRAPTGNEAEPSPTKPVGGGTESSIASAESPLNSDLTPAEFTIGPGTLRFFKIIIDEHTRMAVLEGKFSAKGGAYNDIEVFVFGRDTSMRPGEGLYAKALYKSNRVSTEVLDVPLSPGEYYLVFSNAWSPSVKTISAQVTIRPQPQ